MREPLIPRHGGFRRLKSFQVARLVYDVTARFCARYIDRRSRTRDQMTQAARSGVQNIAEGSQASGTSKKMELKLTNVARASLEELRLDYEDFLRQRGLTTWKPRDPRRAALIARRPKSDDDVAAWVRAVWLGGRRSQGTDAPDGQHGPDGLNGQSGDSKPASMPSMESIPSIDPIPGPPAPYPEIAANGALALIAVATSLLDRQITAQARAFGAEGGFTERLYRVRTARRPGS